MATTDEPIRIGVIGLGFGQHHVRTLVNLDGAKLVAVADRRQERGEACARQYGVTGYTDGIEMMQKEDLAAVCVCSSPAKREDVLRHAVAHRIALFVEKPWATDLNHARLLADLCRKSPSVVMTAFSFRFHPALVRLKKLMEGELGEGWLLNGVYTFSANPPEDHWLWSPEDGNGFFNENSCHLFDAVCHLMGKPVSVVAEAGNFMGSPSFDGAAVSIRFSDGGVAALTIGSIGAGGHKEFPRIDVITAGGQATLQGRGHIWEELTWATRDSDGTQQFAQPPEALGTTRYTDAMTHFLHCVRNGEQPSASADDGVRSVALAMGVYESARTGSRVQLSW
jgi:predicted dehydrogenase